MNHSPLIQLLHPLQVLQLDPLLLLPGLVANDSGLLRARYHRDAVLVPVAQRHVLEPPDLGQLPVVVREEPGERDLVGRLLAEGLQRVRGRDVHQTVRVEEAPAGAGDAGVELEEAVSPQLVSSGR
jgi:hypothetical protein